MATMAAPSLNFGLLGGTDLPMQVQPFKPIDAPAALRSAVTLAGDFSTVQEQMRQRKEAADDRAILQQGLASGEIDLFTPKGIEDALFKLRGKVSVDTYTKLGAQAQKVKEADAALQERISKMDAAALTMFNAGIESAMPFLDVLFKQYQTDLAAGGTESAVAKFNDNRTKLVADMQGKMVGPNTPMFNPQVVTALSSITPDTLPGMISASKYQSSQIKNALDAARAQQLAQSKIENLLAPDGTVVANVPGVGLVDTTTNAPYTGDATQLKPIATGRGRAGAAGREDQFTSAEGTFFRNTVTGETTKLQPDNTRVPVPALPADAQRVGIGQPTGRDWEQFVTPDGARYKFSKSMNRTVAVSPDGTETEVPALPANAVKLGTQAAARAAERAQRVELSPQESERLSRITRTVKLNVPPFGQGEAGSNARNAFYKGLLRDLDALGMGDTEAAIRMAMAQASRKTRETTINRDTTLRSEEGEAVELLGKIEAELKAIGGPASPFIRERWNTVETRLLGNPTFTNLNLYMTQFVDTMGRLSSNATGAAGTPVAYLNFAKTVLDKDFNLEQIQKFRPAFNELINARRKGVMQAYEYLNTLGAAVTEIPGGGGGGAAAISVDQLRQDYNASLARLRGTLSSEERRQELDSNRLIRQTLKNRGVDVPPPGEPTQPPPAGQEVAIRRALRAAGRAYEPDKYEYRIGPDGSVQQRRKAQ